MVGWTCGWFGILVLFTLHDLSNRDTAPDSGKEGQSEDRDGHGDFRVAGNGGADHELAELALDVKDGASVKLALGATATARQHGRSKLAAKLAIEATKASLAGAAQTIGIHVQTTVGTTNGTAQDNVLFVNRVVKHDGSLFFLLLFGIDVSVERTIHGWLCEDQELYKHNDDYLELIAEFLSI